MATAIRIPKDDYEVQLTLTKEEASKLLKVVGHHSSCFASIYNALLSAKVVASGSFSVTEYNDDSFVIKEK